MQLVRGDYAVAASGTVTFRDGDRIYAFGHPFLSLGAAEMPMTLASVVTVVPNANNSFKLAVPGQMVGSISQDRSTGIFGKLGQSPRMIPVKINLRTSRAHEIIHTKCELFILTPRLLNITIFNTISRARAGWRFDLTCAADQVWGRPPRSADAFGSQCSHTRRRGGGRASLALLRDGFETTDRRHNLESLHVPSTREALSVPPDRPKRVRRECGIRLT